MKALDSFVKKYSDYFGYAGVALAMAMFGSQLEVAWQNWTMDAGIWILPLATVVNCTLWCTYAAGRKDWILFTANTFGFCMGFITCVSAFI